MSDFEEIVNNILIPIFWSTTTWKSMEEEKGKKKSATIVMNHDDSPFASNLQSERVPFLTQNESGFFLVYIFKFILYIY